MRYSKLFGKTKKDSKEFDSKNATLLTKAGYIDQVMSGVYRFLPLGLKTLNKIEQIVREEMDEISQELLMSALSPKEFWEKTNRIGIDVLFEVKAANELSNAKNDGTYILNPTHEDNITPLVKQSVQSYKDLPIALYQIQNKFRNEARPKSGLLRGREFRMKDLYSFHESMDDLMKYYEITKEAYKKVFHRLGIGETTVIALASGGDFTENFSHEFQTFCEVGEDLLFYDEVDDVYYNREVAPSKAPDYAYEQELKQREDVFGENIVSVEKLVNFLKVPIEVTIKTLIYEDNDDNVYAVAVRGDYDVDEGKLKKVLGRSDIKLASEETIKKTTGAQIGYAGILDLPDDVKIICDDALENMRNFEVGANKTNYHTINANWDRDVKKPEKFFDIKVAKPGDLNPKSGLPYKTFNSAEVGNIFPLETKFSKAFDFKYTDENGELKYVYMGSYGIGTTRILGVIAETLSDDKGLNWPMQIAPYHLHLISLGDDEEVKKIAENLYGELVEKRIEVLWDDREKVSAGEKFANSELIGIPIRAVISKRSLENGGIEVKLRNDKESKIISVDQLDSFVVQYKQ